MSEKEKSEFEEQEKKRKLQTARLSGYTGNACSNCGSMRMRISGHCQVCEECGTTTGCS